RRRSLPLRRASPCHRRRGRGPPPRDLEARRGRGGAGPRREIWSSEEVGGGGTEEEEEEACRRSRSSRSNRARRARAPTRHSSMPEVEAAAAGAGRRCEDEGGVVAQSVVRFRNYPVIIPHLRLLDQSHLPLWLDLCDCAQSTSVPNLPLSSTHLEPPHILSSIRITTPLPISVSTRFPLLPMEIPAGSYGGTKSSDMDGPLLIQLSERWRR
ncbi:unnamed protein product, partial [Urochloa humidicola]